MSQLIRSILMAILIFCDPLASAQTYPSKPITFVVPFAAGSSTDQAARVLGQALSSKFKVTVVIENKPGAEGVIAAQSVANAAPDGYTALVGTNTTHAADQYLFKRIPYDPVKDFVPVALLFKGFQMMVVRADSPLKTARDLVELARRKPHSLNFGAASSSTRVAGEMVKQMAGIDIVYIPYKTNSQALIDLFAGQIEVLFTDSSTALQQIHAGKARGLAVTGLRRLEVSPEIPTLDESGLNGYEMSSWTAIYFPRNTPPGIAMKLNGMLVQAMRSPEMTQLLKTTGKELFTSTPAGLASFQAAESAKWHEIIKAAGIQPE